jgi:hypothetical protein
LRTSDAQREQTTRGSHVGQLPTPSPRRRHRARTAEFVKGSRTPASHWHDEVLGGRRPKTIRTPLAFRRSVQKGTTVPSTRPLLASRASSSGRGWPSDVCADQRRSCPRARLTRNFRDELGRFGYCSRSSSRETSLGEPVEILYREPRRWSGALWSHRIATRTVDPSCSYLPLFRRRVGAGRDDPLSVRKFEKANGGPGVSALASKPSMLSEQKSKQPTLPSTQPFARIKPHNIQDPHVVPHQNIARRQARRVYQRVGEDVRAAAGSGIILER